MNPAPALLDEMSPKERLRRSLLYQPVDRLPTQVNYTAACGLSMAKYFDLSLEQLPAYLGNHLLRLDITHDETVGDGEDVRFDWWGVGFSTREEGYFAAVNPLAEAPDLDHYAWPDPHDPDLLTQARDTISAQGNDYFVVPNLGFALFERAWLLRGFEQFFIDMVADPAFAGQLLDRIAEIQLALIYRYLDLGVDGGYFGDDYGAQKSLLFSPRMWRSLIKPRLARLFEPFRERGLPIILHTDGQIGPILPDLLEIGLTTLNPVQPEVLDHAWLREQVGGRLSFYGGISTQTTLPQGTAGQVKSAVARAVQTLAPDGTGLLIAPSHRLMSDVPLENVSAMLEAFRQLRT